MFFYFLKLLFKTFSILLLSRIIGSWFPPLANSRLMRFIAFYTDPYLNLFRRIIPPIGVMDISPMFAFIALQILQWVLFSALRAL